MLYWDYSIEQQEELSMTVKCVALDLDGTTLNRTGQLSPENRSVIEAAIARGIHVVIASGRAYDTLPGKVLSIPGIEWAITSNGAAVYQVPEGVARCRHTMTPASVETIFRVAPQEGAAYEAFVDGVAYAGQRMIDDPVKFGCTPLGAEYVRASRTPVPDIVRFMRRHIHELDSIDLVVHTQEQRDRLWRILERESDELYITSSVYHLLELSSHRGGKANGLRWVLEEIGVAPEETVAFGNADNDIDMLNLAGLGVAVADATEGCLAAADRRAGASYENGVAEVLGDLLKNQ